MATQPISPRVAVILATAGVAIELVRTGSFSWIALAICLGHPPYFLIRRCCVTASTLSAFFLENLLLLPVVIGTQFFSPQDGMYTLWPEHAETLLLLMGVGMLTTGGMLCFLAAATRLPIGIFGLVSYLEPALLFIVAILVLEEPLEPGALFSFGLIWAALIMLIGVATYNSLAQRKDYQSANPAR